MSRSMLVVLMICVAVGIYKYQECRAIAAQVGEGPVMYSTVSCPYCIKARKWLDKNDVPYRECDIEAVPACEEEWRRLGGNGVPFFLYKDEVRSSYSPQWMDQTFLNPT